MSRINLKIFTLSWWQWLLILVFVWLLSVLWPVKGFLLPSNWWGQSLIVVMNDNEARPCGGFATAYGVLDLPVPKLEVGSTYELNADLGPAPEPLDQVSDRLKFWDLGTSMDLNQCAEDFAQGYLANTDTEVDRVILVQMSFLEHWAGLLGNETFFADISRQVADVDHHDEVSLIERKDPAGEVMKSMIGKTIFNPFKWKSITKLIKKSEKNNHLYWQNKNRSHSLVTDNVIEVSEWNLGGGKSSRYLRKKLVVSIREITPGEFQLFLDTGIEHLGGQNAPLSQEWRGVIEVSSRNSHEFRKAAASPGYWDAGMTFVPFGEIFSDNKLILRTPVYQNWQVDLSVTLLSEQGLVSSQLSTREGVGTWSGSLPPAGLLIDWETLKDEQPPFLTLHKPIHQLSLDTNTLDEIEWSAGNLITELHFNEPINLVGQAYTMELVDRDFAMPEISEDLTFKGLKLLDNQTTLLINWEQQQYQKDERFYLNLNQIEDIWGNAYENQPRTVITR